MYITKPTTCGQWRHEDWVKTNLPFFEVLSSLLKRHIYIWMTPWISHISRISEEGPRRSSESYLNFRTPVPKTLMDIIWKSVILSIRIVNICCFEARIVGAIFSIEMTAAEGKIVIAVLNDPHFHTICY